MGMKLTSFIAAFIVSISISFAQIPPNYYDNAAFLTGEDLRIALSNIIDNHTVIQYSNLWNKFPQTDATASNKVWDIYSDNPSGTNAYTYNFVSDQCGNYSGEGDCYNREHSVPKSWFNDLSPMNSDLFHIYPTDGYVNGQRGNNVYAEVNSPSSTTSNGSRVGPCSSAGYSGTAFEPIDDYKGDLARTYFYMATRYRSNIPSWTSDMFASNNLTAWAENVLLAWHQMDPVSQKEIDRNNAIYGIQGNRNPYIDHPEWVEYIWGPIAGVNEVLVESSVYYSNGYLYANSTLQKEACLTIYSCDGALINTVAISAGESIEFTWSTGIYIIKEASGAYLKLSHISK